MQTTALDFTISATYAHWGLNALWPEVDPSTFLFLALPTTIDQANRRVLRHGGGTLQIFAGDTAGTGTTGRVRLFNNRLTTATDVESATGMMVANEWQFVAIGDGDGVTPRLYQAGLQGLLTEVASYTTQTTGSGLISSPAAEVTSIGSRISANTESDWQIATLCVANATLTINEMRDWQANWRSRTHEVRREVFRLFCGDGTEPINLRTGNRLGLTDSSFGLVSGAVAVVAGPEWNPPAPRKKTHKLQVTAAAAAALGKPWHIRDGNMPKILRPPGILKSSA